MQKIYLIFIIVLLLPLVVADNQTPNVFLTLADSLTKETIEDVYVKLIVGNETNRYFLEEDETLKLRLNSGMQRIRLLINDPKTESYDYYGEINLRINNNSAVKIVYLYPVGSLEGFVKDNLDNVVKDAELKFECNEMFEVNYPIKTDKFGSFSLNFVPAGSCNVYGSYKGKTGIKRIIVEQGNKTIVGVKLSNISDDGFKNHIIIGIIFLILLGEIIYYFYFKKEKKEEPKQETPEKLGIRANDILKTLRANEKKIIEFLVENGETHLSKIHYKTGISKGSLFRNLKSLEEKNLVECSMEGRIKKVKLSEWMLGKKD